MTDEEKVENAVAEEEVKAEEAAEEVKTEEASEEKAEEAKEKKPNAFSKFWKNTKQSVNDSILESKIKSSFEKVHTEYTIYTKNETFSTTVYGSVEGNVLTVFGKHEVKPYAVVIAQNKEAKAYYTVSFGPATVKSSVEGIEYEREGTAIVLDENVTEVVVVKAGKRYFLYKGETRRAP